jgi:hypothetical protein
MLTGTIASEKIEALCETISKEINKNLINILCSGNICSEAATIEQMDDCNVVIIVESLNKSTYSDVSNELIYLSEMCKNVIGIILI